MSENNKIGLNAINDQQLEEIVGGYTNKLDNSPHVITYNRGTYSSGDFPKYAVGQRVQIECSHNRGCRTKIPCIILSVSEAATGGVIYKEFLYSVEIMPPSIKPFYELKGTICDSVYESCLYDL